MTKKRNSVRDRILFVLLCRAIIVTILLVIFFLICVKVGFLSYLKILLSKVGFFFGQRALSFFLMKMGCSGGLFAAAILFAVRALLATEEEPNSGKHMSPGGEGEIASSSSSKTNLPDLNVPATDEEGQEEKSKTALAEEAVSSRKWDEVGHSKMELAELISPMIGEEANKYQTQKPAPSPQEMVEWLIQSCGSKEAKGANRPGATLRQYQSLLTWLSRARSSAGGDVYKARLNVQSELQYIIKKYFQEEN